MKNHKIYFHLPIIVIFLISILISCKKDTPVVPKVEAFKVSATTVNSNASLDLSGSATTTINLKNDSSFIIKASFIIKSQEK